MFVFDAPIRPPVLLQHDAAMYCWDAVNVLYTWYDEEGEGLGKTCPNCHENRGYAQTYQDKGIDDFLSGFHQLIAEPSGQ